MNKNATTEIQEKLKRFRETIAHNKTQTTKRLVDAIERKDERTVTFLDGKVNGYVIVLEAFDNFFGDTNET